ncbi:hypothetical protein [Pedobacter suwonensis]|uniref:hypothetical protein n=1 Tax=Pedobacter suwonensis TaxID=332999 RepID=UPI0036D02455
MKRLVVMLIAAFYLLGLTDMQIAEPMALSSQFGASKDGSTFVRESQKVYSSEHDLCSSFNLNFVVQQFYSSVPDYPFNWLFPISLKNKYSFNSLDDINFSGTMFFSSERPLVWSKLPIYIRKQSFLI